MEEGMESVECTEGVSTFLVVGEICGSGRINS